MSVASHFHRIVILCVDDYLPGLILRKALLQTEGYRVFTAVHAASALQIVATTLIDAVVLDYEMPVMNGAELAEAILRLKAVPIVVLSAHDGDYPESLHRKSAAIISKDAPPHVLLRCLEHVTGATGGHRRFITAPDRMLPRAA